MEEKLVKFSLKIINRKDITQSVAPSIDLEQKTFNAFGEIIIRLSKSLKEKKNILFYLLKMSYKLFLKERRRKDLESRLFNKGRTSQLFMTYNKYLSLIHI